MVQKMAGMVLAYRHTSARKESFCLSKSVFKCRVWCVRGGGYLGSPENGKKPRVGSLALAHRVQNLVDRTWWEHGVE